MAEVALRTDATAAALSVRAVGAALYYALVPTVLGFHLWYQGESRASGGEAALFTAIYPVAGLLLSASVLGEAIHTQHRIGMALAVVGMAVIALSSVAPGESGRRAPDRTPARGESA